MQKEDLILENLKDLAGSVKELNGETKEQSKTLVRLETNMTNVHSRLCLLEDWKKWSHRLILSIPVSVAITILAILIKGCAF